MDNGSDGSKEKPKPSRLRNFAIYALIALASLFIFQQFGRPSVPLITYSRFIDKVNHHEVESVEIREKVIVGVFTDKTLFATGVISDPELVSRLLENGVSVSGEPGGGNDIGSLLLSFLFNYGPMILFVGIWIFFMRQQMGRGRGIGSGFGFLKSKVRLIPPGSNLTTFGDVAGIPEAKQELQEVIEFLKTPERFKKLGGKIPKGVLLIGPPGTGKTLLARAVAGEANVPFFAIDGSDFVEMFVGTGASRVRDMFEQAKKNAPCIIFIDEIDAVGRHRGAGLGFSNDEKEQTLNQLLAGMDGFEATVGIIMIGATNRPDVLDPALLRAGRFDRQVIVPNADSVGREQILLLHARGKPLHASVNLRNIARGTNGFSGADLANLVNEAALLATRANQKQIRAEDFEAAKDKILMGSTRKLAMTKEEQKIIAYHEAGHAIVGKYTPIGDPVHKVTIVPRGLALGVTVSLPDRDQYLLSKIQLQTTITRLFGGRVAEDLTFGADNITTGASDDLAKATKIARKMVTELGFNEKLGPVRYRGDEAELFLGRSVTQTQHISQGTAQLIDDEIKACVIAGENCARTILESHMSELRNLAKALLLHETLTGEEIDKAMAGTLEIPDPEALDSEVKIGTKVFSPWNRP